MKLTKLYIYILIALVFSACDSTNNNSQTETQFKITSVIYDNNNTLDISDDILYIYYNKDINLYTINENQSENYTINGNGKIGSASVSTYDNKLYRHKIELNSQGTQSIAFDKTDIMTSSSIKSSEDEVVSSIVEKIEEKTYIRKTGNTQADSLMKNDDGDLQYGVSYTYDKDLNNEVVIDNHNKKMIQNSDFLEKVNWNVAKDYCQNLDYANYKDWYMPSISDVHMIWFVSVSKKYIDLMDNYYTNVDRTKYPFYWTSDLNNEIKAYYINLRYGFPHFSGSAFLSSKVNVFCIRDIK